MRRQDAEVAPIGGVAGQRDDPRAEGAQAVAAEVDVDSFALLGRVRLFSTVLTIKNLDESERSKHPQQQTALDALVLLNRLPRIRHQRRAPVARSRRHLDPVAYDALLESCSFCRS